jgi:hypothetical protein
MLRINLSIFFYCPASAVNVPDRIIDRELPEVVVREASEAKVKKSEIDDVVLV